MKIAIMQPYLFPYIGYWQLINAVDKFIILDDVNYIKGGWINRNYILVNGKERLFTLPLSDASPNKLINEIKLAKESNWRKKFFRTLEIEYSKAPNYKDTINFLDDCLSYDNNNLSAFLANSIVKVCTYLNIKTVIVETSSVYNTRSLKKDKRLISICRQELAEEYINPFGGQDLYNKQEFLKEGVKLSFLKKNDYKYSQYGAEFKLNLSIIDVMMFNYNNEITKMLSQYTLI